MEREEVYIERMENPSIKEEVFNETLRRTATKHQSLQLTQTFLLSSSSL
jgi:hypothetical protein